jgi:hypothetical protein
MSSETAEVPVKEEPPVEEFKKVTLTIDPNTNFAIKIDVVVTDEELLYLHENPKDTLVRFVMRKTAEAFKGLIAKSTEDQKPPETLTQ